MAKTTAKQERGVRLTAIVPPPLLEKVRKLAEKEQRTVSQVARRAIHEHVAQQSKKG